MREEIHEARSKAMDQQQDTSTKSEGKVETCNNESEDL